MSTIGNEVSAKPSIEAKVKEDICMIVPGLNVLPYRLRRCLARRRGYKPIIAGLEPQVGFTRLAARSNAELGQARVPVQSIILAKCRLAKGMDPRSKPHRR
jgi:hypothetical protein